VAAADRDWRNRLQRRSEARQLLPEAIFGRADGRRWAKTSLIFDHTVVIATLRRQKRGPAFCRLSAALGQKTCIQSKN
jgi:hypothetical protein